MANIHNGIFQIHRRNRNCSTIFGFWCFKYCFKKIKRVYKITKEICFDYNNIWISIKKDKVVLFDYYSGKLLVYKNLNNNLEISNLGNTPADNVFSWNFYEQRNDNKIVGEIVYTEKDTVMYWIYDKSKNILIDDKGIVFKKIKK